MCWEFKEQDMQGAREYANLFKTGQYGRFYIVSDSHARGETFHIQILPEGEKAINNGHNNPCLNSNAVEVYGITGGQPGWTETYGWLHEGKWQDDFYSLINAEKLDKQSIKNQQEENKKYQALKKQQRVKSLLENYS